MKNGEMVKTGIYQITIFNKRYKGYFQNNEIILRRYNE